MNGAKLILGSKLVRILVDTLKITMAHMLTTQKENGSVEIVKRLVQKQRVTSGGGLAKVSKPHLDGDLKDISNQSYI